NQREKTEHDEPRPRVLHTLLPSRSDCLEFEVGLGTTIRRVSSRLARRVNASPERLSTRSSLANPCTMLDRAAVVCSPLDALPTSNGSQQGSAVLEDIRPIVRFGCGITRSASDLSRQVTCERRAAVRPFGD